jgi:phosphoadenosine phosphosulfate reductase
MYSYTFDAETGGIILNSTPTNFSKEPRPVYAAEMDILGFADYWEYDKQNDVPYMWAESTAYWYRGVKIATITGGDLYIAPSLQPITDEDGKILFGKESDAVLQPIDLSAMCDKNRDLMTVIEDSTVKRIIKEYEKFKKRLDIFHVAFSGGKDSAVLLDLVKKALPKGSFVVIFGDTGMEFPDTYEAVEVTRQQCELDGTPFYTARSHFDPHESWKIFGPPSRTLRWCCSVHKSTPQTIKMRELTGKNDYTGLDFVGVRRAESLARSTYEYENFGKKQKGQYSFNPILEWTSAEVWLHIFINNIHINRAYIKGNTRAGCLLCPMSGGCSDYIRHVNYTDDIDAYVSIIREMNSWDCHSEKDMHTYITSGGWDNRRSGRGIVNNTLRYVEKSVSGNVEISLINPTSDWREWLKTADTDSIPYDVVPTDNGYKFVIYEPLFKKHPTAGKIFRQSLKKAAYCVGCRVCETNCKNGHLIFDNGKIQITDCIQCHECHEIPAGCHMYNSLKIPQGERKMKTINCFDDHAPKRDWLVSFFELKNDFFTEHSLGPNMFTHFKRFLRDAKLIDGNQCTDLVDLISELGWESESALGIILVNLAYENAQFEWYIQEMDVGYYYTTAELKEKLIAADMKEKAANSIIKSFKRIAETPFGTDLNFGYTSDDDMVRTKVSLPDNRVLLYALYKFIEVCNMEKEFHLSYLLDDSIERDGVSPVRLFGIYDEEELKSRLLGLASAHPDFINATFTNDLKTITLRDKTSADVLELFREDI